MPHSTRAPLDLGKGVSLFPTTQNDPETPPSHILVIGAGVTACVSSWILLDKGYKVTMLARELPTFTKAQRLTSQIGAALWEFPYAPCGPQIKPENLNRTRRWAMDSYEIYSALAAEPEVGSKFAWPESRPPRSVAPYSARSHPPNSEPDSQTTGK